MSIRPENNNNNNNNSNTSPSVHWDPPNSSASSTFLINLDNMHHQKPPHESMGTPDYSIPDLYELILSLNKDCGFEPFFNNLVGILNDHFGAQRVSIALPNDPTDIINIPWGLKALWNRDKSPPLEPQFSKQQQQQQKFTNNNTNEEDIDPIATESGTPTGMNNNNNKGFTDDDDDSSWDTDSEDDVDNINTTDPPGSLSRATSFKRKFSLSRKSSSKNSGPSKYPEENNTGKWKIRRGKNAKRLTRFFFFF